MVVFSPQIIENFRRSSADALSIRFLIIWLLGDVFNILGAVLQGVIPTMTILAVYYTLADIVLLGQCFYYRGFTLSDSKAVAAPAIDEEAVEEESTEESSLLPHKRPSHTPVRPTISDADSPSKRGSVSSIHSLFDSRVDASHLSPATPLISPPKPTEIPPAAVNLKSASTLSKVTFNTGALILVCAAGVLGWWLSARYSFSRAPQDHHRHEHHRHERHRAHSKIDPSTVHFDVWGQIFGYICAALYLGSRVPQLLLNYRRKSTEGISMLFFLFACVGNLTYVLSIFAYEPACARIGRVDQSRRSGWCEQGEWSREYGRYILVNASWLIGSAGTLLLDFMVFVQFWMYRGRTPQDV